MAKGFGIAALVISILSMFSPYIVNFAAIWIAMICAIIAALNGDRGLTIGAVVLAAAGLLLFAPVSLAVIVNEAHRSDYGPLVLVFFPIVAAIIALIIDAARRSGGAPASSSGRSEGGTDLRN